MNKTSYQFSKKDIGAAVVFAGFDGGSYSATIVDVRDTGIPLRDYTVRISYFPAGKTPVYATLSRADWGRLTLFPEGSNFLVLETV
jgi:hypothetical protein